MGLTSRGGPDWTGRYVARHPGGVNPPGSPRAGLHRVAPAASGQLSSAESPLEWPLLRTGRGSVRHRGCLSLPLPQGPSFQGVVGGDQGSFLSVPLGRRHSLSHLPPLFRSPPPAARSRPIIPPSPPPNRRGLQRWPGAARRGRRSGQPPRPFGGVAAAFRHVYPPTGPLRGGAFSTLAAGGFWCPPESDTPVSRGVGELREFVAEEGLDFLPLSGGRAEWGGREGAWRGGGGPLPRRTPTGSGVCPSFRLPGRWGEDGGRGLVGLVECLVVDGEPRPSG